jgi:protein gp37
MGEKTGISWCDATFNPWIGCAKVSPGCKHCYAETWGKRFNVEWGVDGDRRKTKTWNDPLKWNAAAKADGVRRRVFCASLADVFEDNDKLTEFRKELFPLIEKCDNLDWLLLTKRPEKMVELSPLHWRDGWPDHVWALTTVENQETAEKRIPELLHVPARVLGLSCEPLLEEVHFVTTGIDWLIVGSESGIGRRPFELDWARNLRDKARVSETAFFMKQIPKEDAKKGVTDELSEFPEDLRIREFPT